MNASATNKVAAGSLAAIGTSGCCDNRVLDARVVFLTHYIPLYQVRVLQQVSRSIADLRILLSTPIEPNRDFQPDWTGLRVDVQKTITLRRRWKHAAGFRDSLFLQIPYDTHRQLKAIRPDVVVSHELGARSMAAARYCRRYGCKLVLATFMSEHTEKGRGWLRQKLRQRLIASADAITYNGPSCRRVLEQLDAPAEKLFDFPYAADDRVYQVTLPRPDESSVRNRLLCIGQLSERKGVLPLLVQLGDYCRRSGTPIELTFAGEGPLRGVIERFRDNTDRDRSFSVNLLGNVPAANLPELMKVHGAVIAPTLADEWLLVVNEAMHQGLPVLGSVYSQAVMTMVQDHVNGWRYDPLAHGNSAGATPPLHQVLDAYFQASDSHLVTMREAARREASAWTPARSGEGLTRAIASVMSAQGAERAGG